MSLYAWRHPLDSTLVVIRDDEGLYFGFDQMHERAFSPMGTYAEARAWVVQRFIERN